jgi:DNA invertase Pin-like site-specific DNA recombinase
MTEAKPKLRCAIYTRKSHEEGLEQDYNSLDAQYDDAAAFIQSQRQQGWVLSSERYDDGGFSGGNLERPALKRLMHDIEMGRVDTVVVYKIDRLSRSLADFAKLVEIFDRHKVTFVSVTQQFNTTTSMGRLTLNILLSFAQFEREVTGERIRDKFAASKKKGLWMGGVPPLGYDVKDRKLIINKQEAAIVRFIFERYLMHGSRVRMVKELEDRCYRAKSWTTQEDKKRVGKKIDALLLHKILRNPVYTGKIHHHGALYPGEHEAIIPQDIWDAAQAQLKAKAPRSKQLSHKTDVPFLLRGVMFDAEGIAMTPSYSMKRGKHYRYYVSTKAIRQGYSSTDLRSIPAEQIEPLVIGHLRQFFTAPEIVHLTHARAQAQEPNITLDQVRASLQRFNEIWDQLFPLEQNRIVRLIVQRIQVSLQGIDVTYQPNGIMEVYGQLATRRLSA